MKKKEMAVTILKGVKSTYVFDFENLTTRLKSNGKFGNTCLGIDAATKEQVLIKAEISPNAFNPIEKDPTALAHIPHCQPTKEVVLHQGITYIIKSFQVGMDTKAFIKAYKGNLKEQQIFLIQCICSLLSTVEAIHHKQIIHSDIRPANIVINPPNEQATLIDFGLAKYVNSQRKKVPFSLIYSPPEQVLQYDELVNETSDIYSVGITLYELCSGTLPFRHKNPEIMLNLQLTQPLEFSPGIDKSLLQIVSKATYKPLFKKPPSTYSKENIKEMIGESQKKRYPSALELKEELITYLHPPKKKFWWK